MRRAYGNQVQTRTEPGQGGVFDVAIDGEMVFRKWDQGRFPANQEILAEIERRLKKA